MKFRIARHTNNLLQLADFYISIIGLDFLGEFKNHDGYDGIFIDKKNLDWHLEFTQTIELANHKFDDDDILVFYPAKQSEYNGIVKKIKASIITGPKNPYWKINGITIKDPDEHPVIISSLKIKEN